MSTGSRNPLDVEIDSALIAPENWRPVDLAQLSSSASGGNAITARFGLTALSHGNDNPPVPVKIAETPASATTRADSLPADAFLSAGPVANDDEIDIPLIAMPPRRVYRASRFTESVTAARNLADVMPDPIAETPAQTVPPQLVQPIPVMPLPAPRPIDWQSWQYETARVRSGGIDKSALTTLIVIMVGVWAAGVGFGLYKLSTPSYGTKILWER